MTHLCVKYYLPQKMVSFGPILHVWQNLTAMKATDCMDLDHGHAREIMVGKGSNQPAIVSLNKLDDSGHMSCTPYCCMCHSERCALLKQCLEDEPWPRRGLRGVEWVHGIFLFPLVLGKMWLPHAKLGPFLCSLDNLLQKNVIVLFFWKSKFKMALIWKKRLFLTYFSHFLVTREKLQNSFSTYLTHIHTRILLTLLTFLSYQFWKKNTNLSDTVSLWYESRCWFLFAPFWNNQ